MTITKYGIVRLNNKGEVIFSEFYRAKKENLTKHEAIRIIEETLCENKQKSTEKQAEEVFYNLFGNAVREK